MKRRDIFKAGMAAGLVGFAPRLAFAAYNPQPKGWRSFSLVTRVEPQDGAHKAWIPLPTFSALDWQKPGAVSWIGNFRSAQRVKDPKYGAEMLQVEWAADQQNPHVEVTAQVQTQSRNVFANKGPVAPLPEAERARSLMATELLPTDGIVKETATRIVAGKRGDEAQARALYDWVVENTFRNAKVMGCGIGDIAGMLRTGNLNGKCADLNALYVGMARSIGLPARDVYGLRVVASEFGYRSLGAGSANVTKAQHCRAEVWLEKTGWTPVDPADVRKVVLEEPPGNLAMTDAKVVDARKALFGQWEGNWIAYNDGHDIKLPGSSQPAVAFLMYPQAETKVALLDCLDPDKFKYSITSKELTA